MSDFSNEITWRFIAERSWNLFTNNNYKIKEKQKSESPSFKSLFYFSHKKPESKGTLVYTPEGYGIIQEINDESETIVVKITNTNKLKDFPKQSIMTDIPINVTFYSGSYKGEETFLVPITSSAKEIVSKIENSFANTEENIVNVQVLFHGKDFINQASSSLEKIGIIPYSKFLAIPEIGRPFILTRFSNIYEGWGYSDRCINAIAFTASKDIKIRGFGIFTPDNSYTDARAMTTVAKFVKGTDDSGNVLHSKEIIINKSEGGEGKIFSYNFDRPIRIKAGELYSCVQEAVGTYNCYTYYGDSGQNEIVGDKEVVFVFSECFSNGNNSNRSCGQIPEIYYYA